MPASLGHRIAQSAAWMVGSRMALRAIGLVSTIVLARLLRPEDFGLISLAMALVAAMDTMSNFTFDMALIRLSEAQRQHYDTVWTLTIIRSALVSAALVALAGPAASFFAEPRLGSIVYWFAAGTLLEGLQNVGVVDFRKDLDFHREFAFQIIAKLIGFVATVTLAILWRDFWALVVGIIVGKVALLILSYSMHAYRPRLSLTEWRSLFRFSAWLLVSNISYFLGARLDTFVIGRVLDIHTLGVYEISSEISSLPTSELVAPIHRALYPGYTKMLEDPARLAQGYIGGLAVIMMIALPAAAGIACVAGLIVNVFLGSNWLEVRPLLQVLTVAGMFKVWYANSTPVLLALGRVKLLSHLAMANVALFAICVIIGTLTAGAMGTAFAAVATSAIASASYVVVTMNLLSASYKRLFFAVWRTLSAVAVMVLTVGLLTSTWVSSDAPPPVIIQLTIAVVLGVLTYTSVLLTLWWIVGSPDGPERDVRNAIVPAITRLRALLGVGSNSSRGS